MYWYFSSNFGWFLKIYRRDCWLKLMTNCGTWNYYQDFFQRIIPVCFKCQALPRLNGTKIWKSWHWEFGLLAITRGSLNLLRLKNHLPKHFKPFFMLLFGFACFQQQQERLAIGRSGKVEVKAAGGASEGNREAGKRMGQLGVLVGEYVLGYMIFGHLKLEPTFICCRSSCYSDDSQAFSPRVIKFCSLEMIYIILKPTPSPHSLSSCG